MTKPSITIIKTRDPEFPGAWAYDFETQGIEPSREQDFENQLTALGLSDFRPLETLISELCEKFGFELRGL